MEGVLPAAFLIVVGLPQDPAGTSSSSDVLVISPRDDAPLTATSAHTVLLSADDLERTGERSLPRAISRAAGVFLLESNLGGGAPVLRGLLGNQVLILVDGVRVNDATTRLGPNQSLNTIDPAIVERVEVRLGPASVLYGSDALGGVIAIWTKRRSPQHDGGVTGWSEVLHDTATRGWRGSFALSGANDDVGWLGILSGAEWNDLVAGGGDTQEETGFHTGAGFGSVEWELEEGRTLRATSWVNRDFDVPRTFQVVTGFGQSEPSFAHYDFVLQDRSQTVLTFEDELGLGLGDRLQARLFARSYLEQRSRRRTGSSTDVFGETDVDSIGLGVDIERRVGDVHRLTYGVELIHDDVDSYNVRTDVNTGVSTPDVGDFAPNARHDTLGVYVQDETTLLQPVLLTLGLRWSRHDFAFDGDTERERRDFDDLTASVEAAYDVDAGTRVSATLAQGFQAPNLEDLANDGDFAGGTELANPDLEPAKSLTAELGLDLVRGSFSLRGAAFATRIEDVLGRQLLDVGDPNTVGDELYMRENAGRLDLWGIEVGGSVLLGGNASPWSIEGVASWVRGRQYDDTLDGGTGEAPLDGVEARRVPPLHGHIGLVWRATGAPSAVPVWLDEAGLSLGFALEQDQLHPDDIADPRIDPTGTDGWTVWSLNVGGPLSERVHWSAGLINLLDESYRSHGSGIEGPGRSAVFSLRAGF